MTMSRWTAAVVLAALLGCGANEPRPVEFGPDGAAVLPEENGT